MIRGLHVISFFGFLCAFSGLSLACSASQEQEAAAFERIRTVTLPVEVVRARSADTSLQNPERLAITRGAEDELPQGPQGFEVLLDGSFVVADPLRRRLVFYDSLGAYVEQWPIGLPVGHLSLLDDGALEVQNLHTGAYYRVDEFGQVRQLSSRAQSARGADRQGKAVLDRSTGNRGQITWTGARGAGADTLEVTLESDTMRMVSLQSLGRTPGNLIYVALETAQGSGAIDIRKIIRAYDADGQLVGQIDDIPLDYFIHPTNEFQVAGNRVYQLMPGQDAVRINVWALQEQPAGTQR